MRRGVLLLALGAVVAFGTSGCVTYQGQADALWFSETDGSIICPSSNDCPKASDGQEYAGMIIPAALVDERQVEAAVLKPQQIVCIAGQARAECPAGYSGRLWRPTKNQIVCRPGDGGEVCGQPGVTGRYAFLCAAGSGEGFCPGVPRKEPKQRAKQRPR